MVQLVGREKEKKIPLLQKGARESVDVSHKHWTDEDPRDDVQNLKDPRTTLPMPKSDFHDDSATSARNRGEFSFISW